MGFVECKHLSPTVKTLPTYKTASGSVATFETDMTENLVEVKCQIVAQQASGTPSPDNPLPITTYTEMNVWRGNNNLLPNTATTQTINDVTFTINADKSITVNGLATADTNFVINQTTDIKKSGNYILRGCPQYGSSTTYYMCSTRGLVVSDTGSGSYPTAYNVGDALYMFIHIHGGYNADNLVFKPMIIHENETDLTYHAYNGTTSNIPFGQTVANGVLDVLSGKLTITHGYVDLGSLNWTAFVGSALKMIYMHFSDCPAPPDNLTRANLICSNMPTKSRSEIRYSEPYDDGIGIDINGNLFVAYPSGTWTDLTSAQNGLSGWYMCYELTTPITIQLTSEEVVAIVGTNNLFADTGDVTAKYILSVGKALEL